MPHRFVESEQEQKEALKLPDARLLHDGFCLRVVCDHPVSVDVVAKISVIGFVDPTALLDMGPEPSKIRRARDVGAVQIRAQPRGRFAGATLLASS